MEDVNKLINNCQSERRRTQKIIIRKNIGLISRLTNFIKEITKIIRKTARIIRIKSKKND